MCPVAGDNPQELPDYILLENNKDGPMGKTESVVPVWETSASLPGDETRNIEE